jgi:4-amino-4-deoxy-L-arabinose transferase-like glycosyltransferase
MRAGAMAGAIMCAGAMAGSIMRAGAMAPAALLALTALRLVVAAIAPLAPDEAYYWIWSRALAPGYLDHPPMVALWIVAGTAIAGQGELGIRLLGPLSAALGSWLLVDTADRLFPGHRAGLTAAVLLNATLLLGVGSIVMTPDTPLLFFWIAAFWALARIATGGAWPWWLAVGLFAGLALATKYTAALLWFGIGAWLIVSPQMRRWLRHPAPWLGALLGAAVFSPVVLWNQAHGWAGFLRQGGRLGDWRPERAVGFLLELIGSQAGLVTPWIWILSLAGIALALKRTIQTRDPVWTLLVMLSVPAVLLFLQHALGDRVQGNWPAIAYPAAIVAAAGPIPFVLARGRWAAACMGLAIVMLTYLQVTTGALPIPARLDPIALRLTGWDKLAEQIEAVRRQTGASYVVAEQYALAAELARHMPPGVQVVAREARWSLFALPPAETTGRRGLLVSRAGEDTANWPGAVIAGSAERAGIESYQFHIVEIMNQNIPATALPRP